MEIMQRTIVTAAVVASGLSMAAATAVAAGFPAAPVRRCAPDAVVAGTVCLDTYEASVWRVPDPTNTGKALVLEIQRGLATVDDLRAGGATRLGLAPRDYAPCRDDGQNCANDIYAVSLPSVMPSAFITWFQAAEACANAGKRLPTSAEWQVGANGTPDPGVADNGTTDCNTVANDGVPTLTGTRRSCVSARGAFDMVGNLGEWVAEWAPASTNCPSWGGFSDDVMCLAGASTTSTSPGALLRGGAFFDDAFFLGPFAGPLSVADAPPNREGRGFVGFRCAR